MLNKLNFKRDKIVAIQHALETADKDGNQQLDFDEWRSDLKAKGYAEAEIEAVFSKYDLDGDRILDETEKGNMEADLKGQHNALDREYDQLEEKKNDSDESDEEGMKGFGGAANGVSYEEFRVLSRRVDRMEHSIGSIVSKIDAVLVKLEAMERAKSKRRETMNKILDSITEVGC